MTKPNKAFIGPSLIILAAMFWGFDGLLRRTLFQLPPIIIVFYETTIGSLLIASFALPKIIKTKLTPKDWLALTWVSLLSGVLGTLWFTTALLKTNFISFSVVFLLQKLQPLFAITTASILLKEKLSKRFALWAAIALGAAYFVTFPGGKINLDSGPQTIIAAAFALAAAFAWGSSTAFSRYALIKHDHTAITGLRFAFSAVISFLLVFVLGQQAQLSTVTQDQLIRLVIIALSTGLVALWIYYKGLKSTQVKISTILELVFPLTAVAIDVVFFDNILELSQFLAAGVLILAVLQIAKQNPQK